jgi:hypothetical protein
LSFANQNPLEERKEAKVHLKLFGFISSIFMIILALITASYEMLHEKNMTQIVKMYPYFDEIKPKIDKIDIRFPETTLSIVRDNEKWLVTSSDNFPANHETIERLFQEINALELISSKTQKNYNFSKINLLNPTPTETKEGEGIRITLSVRGTDKKHSKPYIDFIVGEKLNSYVNQSNIRFFTRYGTSGGAYLAQATTDFQYSTAHFLTSEFGMPKINEVISADLNVNNQSILKLYRVVDNQNLNNILFMPAMIPEDKKLLYPLVMGDYMMAFINQLKPIDAIKVSLAQSLTDISMTLELTQSRINKVNFWSNNHKYYMRIVNSDSRTPNNQYIYQITKADYDMLIQPLDKFLSPITGSE